MKKNFTSIKKGVIKAYHLPVLPDNILKLYTHPFCRVFRVIGGISALLVLTKEHLILPYPLNYVVILLALIQLIQIVLISIIKLIFGIRKVIYNPEEFEVRNSPLDRYASHISKLLYCWKVGCQVGQTGLGVVGASVVIDTFLEQTGHEKVILPFIAKGIKLVTGSKATPLTEDARGFYADMQYNITQLKDASERHKRLTEITESLDVSDFLQGGISMKDAEEIKTILLETNEASKDEVKDIALRIISQVEELKKK